MRDFRLYVILDIDICNRYGNIIEIAKKVISAGADVLQLRAKGYPDSKTVEIGRSIKSLIKEDEALFIINDRVDLTSVTGADGVHLGQQDLSIKDARKILGVDKIIGISTHNIEEASRAENQGADYIGIGPIFATTTKPETAPLTPGILTEIKNKVGIPFVAIGGINLDNLDQILSCGVKRIAVCSAIITARDVFAATKEFRQRLYYDPIRAGQKK